MKENSLYLLLQRRWTLSKVDLLVFISIYQHMLTLLTFLQNCYLNVDVNCTELVFPGNCHSDQDFPKLLFLSWSSFGCATVAQWHKTRLLFLGSWVLILPLALEKSSMEQHDFKNVSNCFNTNIYSCSETSDGQSSNLYLNAVHFFNTSVN